ncbi:unnamed protein product [Gemmata massiliana]|uniref:Uncharacterized protein n=1 Tax=Gemmata massiliana TaxID=1210884 RepID=A0A6P2D3N7_9BACT|nr:unnamed protein product [Gemmata massiliana]
MWRVRPIDALGMIPASRVATAGGIDRLAIGARVVRGAYGFFWVRTVLRSRSWMVSRVPLWRHSSKYRHTVLLGGKSLGRSRHGHPVRKMGHTASTTTRGSVVRGRPPGYTGA